MNFNNSNKTKLYNVLLLYLLFHENGIFLSLFIFSLTFSHVLLVFFFVFFSKFYFILFF